MRVVPARWHVRSNTPVTLPPDSRLEPDQCVVQGWVRDYILRSPGASDVGLLVEMADTSLAEDRKMAQTYGARGITVYWIVNLVDREVEHYALPTSAGYSGVTVASERPAPAGGRMPQAVPKGPSV
jgi:Uma2 family endonuclease